MLSMQPAIVIVTIFEQWRSQRGGPPPPGRIAAPPPGKIVTLVLKQA